MRRGTYANFIGLRGRLRLCCFVALTVARCIQAASAAESTFAFCHDLPTTASVRQTTESLLTLARSRDSSGIKSLTCLPISNSPSSSGSISRESQLSLLKGAHHDSGDVNFDIHRRPGVDMSGEHWLMLHRCLRNSGNTHKISANIELTHVRGKL